MRSHSITEALIVVRRRTVKLHGNVKVKHAGTCDAGRFIFEAVPRVLQTKVDYDLATIRGQLLKLTLRRLPTG